MRVWKVEYTKPGEYAHGDAVVLAQTAILAIRALGPKLKMAGHRIHSVVRIDVDDIVK